MKKYTKEQLIFFLKKLSKELKRTPTIKDMNKSDGYPSATTYMKRFGTWNDALTTANLTVNVKIKHEKEELLENLKQLGKELGKTPKATDIKDWMASYSTYRKYFGTWKKALAEAGLVKKTSSLKEFIKKKN
ncbi:MAG: hypothetical protein V1859_07905 [archaeon]